MKGPTHDEIMRIAEKEIKFYHSWLQQAIASPTKAKATPLEIMQEMFAVAYMGGFNAHARKSPIHSMDKAYMVKTIVAEVHVGYPIQAVRRYFTEDGELIGDLPAKSNSGPA